MGTFLMLLVGGAAILTGQSGPLVALAFGGAITVMIYALGHVCGAHFNPSITLAFAATGHFPWPRVASYVAAQLAGAFAACLLLLSFAPVDPVVASGSLQGMPAFLVEVLATFLLAFVIIAVATDSRAAPGVAGLAIGTAVFLGALVAGPLTGAAMNPARAIAPAVLAGQWASLAVHIAGPFVGGSLAMFAYEGMRRGVKPRREEVLGATGPIDLRPKT